MYKVLFDNYVTHSCCRHTKPIQPFLLHVRSVNCGSEAAYILYSSSVSYPPPLADTPARCFRLTNLQQVNRVHTQERENVRVGLEQSRKSALELENRTEDSIISKLNRKYQFMQEMRSYVRDLVECFNEKVSR